MATPPPATARLGWRPFLIAFVLSLLLLGAVVAVPQWFSQQARFEVLRGQVVEIAQLAAAMVDGDLHGQLIDPARYSDDLYQQALRPLVRLHSANDKLFYVYTMVEREGVAHFVLDTATSPLLKTRHALRPSAYMEPFRVYDEYQDGWLDRLRSGETYVYPRYQRDDYGFFLSGHTPIYDSEGRYVGFVGIDYDLDYYLQREERFRWISFGSGVGVLLLSLLVAYQVGRHYRRVAHRIDVYHDAAQRDALTSLLNRRGAMQAIEERLRREREGHAVMLIDIDDFKLINDTYGHATGDSVLTSVAEVIRQSVRDSDVIARLGGDEFLIFAPNCDSQVASSIAARILEGVRGYNEALVCSNFSVSIGICPGGVPFADFAELYRWADEALYRAKAKGKNRFAFFWPRDARPEPVPA
jgi:diguanylate cyclase (GGDEF)-like protein